MIDDPSGVAGGPDASDAADPPLPKPTPTSPTTQQFEQALHSLLGSLEHGELDDDALELAENIDAPAGEKTWSSQWAEGVACPEPCSRATASRTTGPVSPAAIDSG